MIRPLLSVLVVSLALAVNAQGSRTDPDTVQSLRADCRAPPLTARKAACKGYVTGTADQLAIEGHICPRAATTPADEVQAFLDWADTNSERWNIPKAAGVLVSLHQAWRCDESSRFY